MQDSTRRKLLLGLVALPITRIASASIPTPAASEGPFYPTGAMRFNDIDNDLVRVGDAVEQAGGEVVRLSGRVLDRVGNPLPAARVEIWQCDVSGRYLHRGDSGSRPRDRAFQGFGHDLTGADGRYSFRTIKPVPYAGRTPHIHVKVFIENRERLTTQFYLPDHPGNARDWLYQRIPAAQRELVTMKFNPAQGEPTAIVDLVV
ncbi:MAG: protocatechuate 3,4-dioxygenase [Gammaproteobacteria bacterium]|nr:protocatechuate 3,4-dioxygenase [Gammaproteobacteria bacterium]MDH3535862.1 protocatechuate 3,4-dioxygenase [Gammaproteobacteria bacterium]